MKLIKEIVESMHEEIEGAEDYAKKAVRYKEEDRPLADAYYSMAGQELGHVDMLHAQVVRIIKAYQAAGNEPPAVMKAVWDWEHGKVMDHVAKVKVLLETYRK